MKNGLVNSIKGIDEGVVEYLHSDLTFEKGYCSSSFNGSNYTYLDPVYHIKIAIPKQTLKIDTTIVSGNKNVYNAFIRSDGSIIRLFNNDNKIITDIPKEAEYIILCVYNPSGDFTSYYVRFICGKLEKRVSIVEKEAKNIYQSIELIQTDNLTVELEMIDNRYYYFNNNLIGKEPITSKSDGYRVSNKVIIPRFAKKISTNCHTSGSSVNLICDVNGLIISSFKDSEINDIPENAFYVCFSDDRTGSKTVTFYHDGLATRVSDIENNIKNIKFYGTGVNLLDASKLVYGYYINAGNGNVAGDGTYPFKCTEDYVDISENNGYLCVVGFNNNLIPTWSYHRCAFYDKNKKFISGFSNGTASGNTDTSIIEIPENAKYFRASFHVNELNIMILPRDTINGLIYEAYEYKDASPLRLYDELKEVKKNEKVSQWNGLVWSAYGDSITGISNGNSLTVGWARYINQIHNFANYYGRGIGGQSFKWGSAGGNVSFINADGTLNSRDNNHNKDNYSGNIPSGCSSVRGCFCSWDRIIHMYPASIKDTIDMIFVMGGTNDSNDTVEAEFIKNNATDIEWASSEYYSTYNGDYNISASLKGAVASTVMKLQAWMPQALIIIGTPLSGRGNTGEIDTSLDIQEYAKSENIKEIAKKLSCPCIDIYANSGINPLNRNTYITDGVHPYSDKGKKMLARTISGALMSIYPNIN